MSILTLNKAMAAFNLGELFAKANARVKELKGKAVNDISQELKSDDKFIIVICRKPGDNGSFKEPHNIPISKNVVKPEFVKVFCEEYLKSHSKHKKVEYFSDASNVFNLALIYDDPDYKEKPVTKTTTKNTKKVTKVDPAQPAKNLIENLVRGDEGNIDLPDDKDSDSDEEDWEESDE